MSRWIIRFHPLIQPEGVRVPVVEVLPHGTAAPIRPSVLASPERARRHRNAAFTRLADVSPRWLRRTAPGCEFTPPSIMSCRCAWSDRHSRGDNGLYGHLFRTVI